MPKGIALLGATGSIGESTLRVIRKHPDQLTLVSIAGNSRYRELAAIAHEFSVKQVAIFDEKAAQEARESDLFPAGTEITSGLEGLITVACLNEVQLVVTAVVGTLSLKPTLAAIEHGKDIALASKEILVMAGKFVMAAAREKEVQILPLDSEHNAIFQCLQGERTVDVDKLILTASGGPFRDYTPEQMQDITLEKALQHPNWSMGPKVTIDSSTMANKGLEIIEARWLFDKKADDIQVVVHPQSIVHSMVQFVDGSVVAQLSPPSMTFAIQHSLLYPQRATGVDTPVDFTQALVLDFRPPDYQRFPCLRLAFESLRADGMAPAIFNAANEVAVDAFVNHRLSYAGIARIIEKTLEILDNREPNNLDEVLAIDTEARQTANQLLETS